MTDANEPKEHRDRRDQSRPLLGVGAVIFRNDSREVLLIRRGASPSKGLWSFPGGLVEWGEELAEACRREVREETGLSVDLDATPVQLVNRIIPDDEGQVRYHYLIIDFIGRAKTGTLAAASDVTAARWLPLEEVATLDTTAGLPQVLERALQRTRGQSPDTPLVLQLSQPTR